MGMGAGKINVFCRDLSGLGNGGDKTGEGIAKANVVRADQQELIPAAGECQYRSFQIIQKTLGKPGNIIALDTDA